MGKLLEIINEYSKEEEFNINDFELLKSEMKENGLDITGKVIEQC